MITPRDLFKMGVAMTQKEFNQPQPSVDVELAWAGSVTRSGARAEHDPETGTLRVFSTITGEEVDRFAPGAQSWRVARCYNGQGTLLAIHRCEV